MMLSALVAHATDLPAPFLTGGFCLKGNSSDGRAGSTAGMDRVTRGGQRTDNGMAEKDREIGRFSKSPGGAVEKPQAALHPAAQPEITDHKTAGLAREKAIPPGLLGNRGDDETFKRRAGNLNPTLDL